MIAALESLPAILQSALSQAGVDLTSALYGLTGDSVGKIDLAESCVLLCKGIQLPGKKG